MFPLGRSSRGTRPLATGSLTLAKTIGIVRVSRWRAAVAGVPAVTMMSGCSPTNSCASARIRLVSSPYHRRSIRTLRPSAQPKPASACVNAETKGFDSRSALGAVAEQREAPGTASAAEPERSHFRRFLEIFRCFPKPGIRHGRCRQTRLRPGCRPAKVKLRSGTASRPAARNGVGPAFGARGPALKASARQARLNELYTFLMKLTAACGFAGLPHLASRSASGFAATTSASVLPSLRSFWIRSRAATSMSR